MRIHRFVQICNQTKKSQAGVSLVETVVALGLLMIAAAGILTFATVAMSTTETQGHLAARTAEYAQDKMEQLLALSYRDIRTDTTRWSPTRGRTESQRSGGRLFGLRGCKRKSPPPRCRKLGVRSRLANYQSPRHREFDPNLCADSGAPRHRSAEPNRHSSHRYRNLLKVRSILRQSLCQDQRKSRIS